MSELMRILDRGYQLIWREDRIEDALRGLGPDFEWIVPDHPEGARRQGPHGTTDGEVRGQAGGRGRTRRSSSFETGAASSTTWW